MAEQAHFNVNRAFTANNAPSAGALAYFYESGTTTPLTVYSDEALTTPHASPLVADAEGVFDPVYVSGSVAVKVEVKSAAGATLTGYPIDPVMLDGTSDSGAAGILFTPTTTNTATDVQTAIENNDAAIQALEASIANPFTIMTTAGTGDAFTGVAAETVTAYAVGQEYLVKFDRAPTGAATLNIDGAGLKDIKKYDAAGALADIASGDWSVDRIAKLVYDGTRFIFEGPLLATETAQGLVEKSSSAENAAGVATGKYPDVAGVVEIIEATAPPLTIATAQTTTSGTEFDFPSIPAGVNKVFVAFDAVSLSGTDDLLVQIGDAGGIEATGYASSSSHSSGDSSSTTGFNIVHTVAGDVASGLMTLIRMDGNRWVQSHGMTRNTSGSTSCGGGIKTLSAELTQVRITRSGTDTFDAGSVNISYE